MSIKTRLTIGYNAYKSISPMNTTVSLLKNYARTLSMMHWSELDNKERKIIEKYSNGRK